MSLSHDALVPIRWGKTKIPIKQTYDEVSEDEEVETWKTDF